MTYLNYAVDLHNDPGQVTEDWRARFEVEHDGQRLEFQSTSTLRVRQHGSHRTETWVSRPTVYGLAGLAEQMVKAGWPDGDIHVAHCVHPCHQVYMGEKGEPFDIRLIQSIPIDGAPFERRYHCSMGTVQRLARWHGMPRVDHNHWNQVLQTSPNYQDIQEMRKWLSGDPEAKLEFVHEWIGWASSGALCAGVAKRELNPVPEGIIRPNDRKTRHYYIDLLTDVAAFSFYLRWRGCQERVAKVIEWVRWPEGINQ